MDLVESYAAKQLCFRILNQLNSEEQSATNLAINLGLGGKSTHFWFNLKRLEHDGLITKNTFTEGNNLHFSSFFKITDKGKKLHEKLGAYHERNKKD